MYQVNEALCQGCASCMAACPEKAIRLVNERAFIRQERCTECGACFDACPNGAIERVAAGVPAVAPAALVTSPVAASSQASSSRSLAVAQQQEVSLPALSTAESWQNRLRPALSAVALWAGRELLPNALTLLRERALQELRSPASRVTARSNSSLTTMSAARVGWGGGRHRRRRGPDRSG